MKYLIIGNSAAAIGAVEGIRAIDHEGEIMIVSQEKEHCYSRPLISYYLAGKVKREGMYYRPLDFYERQNVTTYLGQQISLMSLDERFVNIQPAGLHLEYDQLLIATGGTPFLPPVFHQGYQNVFTFNRWDEIERINESLEGLSTAVIIGGGLIGLKAAESLHARGLKVTVIEAAPHLLSSILDQSAALFVQKHLEANGITVITGTMVEGLNGGKIVEELVLADGRKVAGELFIVAAGMRPNIFSSLENLAHRRGILVDQQMQTSIENVYAAGDVAEALDPETNDYLLTPIWPSAYRQGRIAGFNMAGKREAYEGGPVFNSIPLLGLNIATAGLSKMDADEFEVIEKNESGIYKRITLHKDAIQGLVFIGDISRCGIYRFLIENKIKVSDFRERLLADDFGIIDIPRKYRKDDFVREVE